jgi:hypothetical protein
MSTTAYFDGRTVSRREVQQWELMRGKRALRWLGSYLGREETLALVSGDMTSLEPEALADLRPMLAELKAGLGPDGTRTMMGSRCKRSALAVKAVLALSRGRRKLCTIDVLADGIGAQDYFDWFMHAHESNDEAAMLASNPDHWLIRLTDDGRQEVGIAAGSGFPCSADRDGPAPRWPNHRPRSASVP